MAKLNTEFNYRYQIIGETVWEKIKTLYGFLDGRQKAAAMEAVSELRRKAKLAELEHLKSIEALPHVIMEIEAEIMEGEAFVAESKRNYELNREEIKIIEKLLKECYEIAEPTRLKHKDGTPYSDEEMFEVNAANEFTTVIAREIHAEVIANGRPSAAKIKNAMSNPLTWTALKNIGLIPKDTPLIASNVDPTIVQLQLKDDPVEAIEHKKENLQIEYEKGSAKIERKEVKFL
jgi:hypothetical protein